MIVIVMGVSGSGKSTVGALLAKKLQWPFYEGDDFHSRACIEKMKQGLALTDEDRREWLAALAQFISGLDRDRQSAVIACSALKQAYRAVLAGSAASVHFIYLKGSYDVIRRSMQNRTQHFFPAGLLQSQFDILEEPGHAVVVDVAETPEMIADLIRQALGL